MKRVLILMLVCLTGITWIGASGEDSMSIRTATELDHGIILFGAHTGTRVASYEPFASDALVKGAEVYTPGWGYIEKEEGVFDWSLIDQTIALYKLNGKKICVRIPCAASNPNVTPRWLHTRYGVRRALENLAYANFDDVSTQGDIEPLGVVTTRKSEVHTGGASMKSGVGDALRIPSLNDTLGYLCGFDALCLADGAVSAVLTDEAGNETLIRRADAVKGERLSVEMDVPGELIRGVCALTISVTAGEFSFDNINYAVDNDAWGSDTLSYPNYFDPIFKQKYEAFVRAFARRYYDEPTIAMVVAGGFGRWDEPTMLGDFLESGAFNMQMLVNEWLDFGYTDDKFIELMDWSAALFADAFEGSGKQVQMHSIAFDLPGNIPYVNWRHMINAADAGLVLKMNGLSSRLCEWGGDTNTYLWLAERYKHDPRITLALETGGQVNNHTSNIMGHPLLVFNRALIHNVKHLWFYQNDIVDINVNKYMHYANELAGSALFTKLWYNFGKFPFIGQSGVTAMHTDTGIGLHTANFEQLTYGEMDGVTYVKTNDAAHTIRVSIDDRQEYSGMYGVTITLTYLDEGTDALRLVALAQDDKTATARNILAQIQKTGSGEWRTLTVYTDAFLRYKRNGGSDVAAELLIESVKDGHETVSWLEIDYVPAREWAETPVIQAPAHEQTRALGKTPYVFEVAADAPLSGIAVQVKRAPNSELAMMYGKVYAEIDGEMALCAQKELFMPSAICDMLYFPVAHAQSALYRVELYGKQGETHALLDINGSPAYTAYAFELTPEENWQTGVMSVKSHFAALMTDAPIGERVWLDKQTPSGEWLESVAYGVADARGMVYLQPQTAGIYRLGGAQKARACALKRLATPNAAYRFELGDALAPGFEQPDIWRAASGLSDIRYDDNEVMRASVSARNPVIETARPLSIPAAREQVFHMVIKNATDANLCKVYWKTDADDSYGEERACYVPIAPNDDRFREYSWPIGEERGYRGNTITGFMVMPVYNCAGAGDIAIASMALRENRERLSGSFDELNADKLDMRVPVGAAAD